MNEERQWDYEVDFLVIGSGAGGLTAAISAHVCGLDALVVEKSSLAGGSSALSGGGIWVPNNPLMPAAGIKDTLALAQAYLQHTVGSAADSRRQHAYLEHAPRMLAFLHAHTHARFAITPGYPDYYPELPGGLRGGRSLEPLTFQSRRLGKRAALVRPSNIRPPLGMGVTAREARRLYMLARSAGALLAAAGVFLANLAAWLRGGSRWALGQALVGSLLLSLDERGIPLWLDAPAEALVLEGEQVTGVVVRRAGQVVSVRARRGVLLASGGFEHNQAMRQAHLPQPTSAAWSAGNPANTGDGIDMGRAAGAALDLMDEAWWTPVSLPPGGPPMIHIGERSFPCQLIVDASGSRFVNEAAPYHAFGQAQYARHAAASGAVPCFMVFDQRFRCRYLFGQTLPVLTPRRFLRAGYLLKAPTLPALAQQAGIDPAGLEAAVQRFNALARGGQDPDFGRGGSLYDRYYGDATVRPNPCLGPVEKPPFYAVALYPGDLGTRGGLRTDERARVLRADGKVICGLYACGNVSASVMGRSYPGAGSTLGPAMTFGYLAAEDAAA